MKLVIVTVYNSHNSGSFLQAYSLYSVLREMGHDVAFLERDAKGSSHDKIIIAKEVINALIRLKFKRALDEYRQWYIYEKLQKSLPVTTFGSEFYKSSDCIVLGSDTIWNFDANYFLFHASTYLGFDFKGKNIISYAASAGNTGLEKFKGMIGQYGNLSNITPILVRDKHTKNLVETTTPFKATIVVDPTLIANRIIYKQFITNIRCKTPFLLLYFFGIMPITLKNALLKYARDQKLIIVSMPLPHSWCELSIMSSPQNMVSYFSTAQSVVTNTFHGTAFSMIYEKPFAVYDNGQNKVKELLATYNESNRLFTKPEQIPMILSKPNSVISSGIMDLRKKDSITKLANALKDKKNENS